VEALVLAAALLLLWDLRSFVGHTPHSTARMMSSHRRQCFSSRDLLRQVPIGHAHFAPVLRAHCIGD